MQTAVHDRGARAAALEHQPEPEETTGPASSSAQRRLLVAGSAGILGLRVMSLGLSFAVRILLARLLGVRGFGAFESVMAWVAICAVPAGLGTEKLLLRHVAAYRVRAQWSLMRGLLRDAVRAVWGASVAIVLLAAVAIALLAGAEARDALWIGLLLLPVAALTRVYAATLQGLERVVWGQLPDLFLVPLLMAIPLATVWFFGSGTLTVGKAVLCFGVASAVALVVVMALAGRWLPSQARAAAPAHDRRVWLAAALPFLALGALQVVHLRTDIVMLGLLATDDAVGRYAAGQRLAALIGVVLLATNAPLAPLVARLHAGGDAGLLQDAVTRSTRLAFAAACPLALALVVLGPWILGLFGPEFVAAWPAMMILVAGQLFGVAMGGVGPVLMMTGHTSGAVAGLAVGGIVNVGLNALLIPRYGVLGAAIATATSMVVWNLLLAWFVHRRLGLYATIVGRRG